MKKIYSQLLLATMATLTILTGCKEDDGLNHTDVSPVAALYAPENNAFLNLGAQSTAVFEWEAAKAEDNGVVLYDVVFDKEEGDFSNPVYTVPSDGKGLQRILNIPFSELSRIAAMAGIQPEGTGKLKWTVLSSKGINVQESVVSRIIEVERPAGFPAPDELFIAGSGTEGGEALIEAIPMKKTSANTFEVYTTLQEGEYYFASRKEGTPDTYFIENGKLKANGTTAVTGEKGVYRIRVDFSTATTEVSEIEAVELYFSPNDEFLFGLPYTGNGTWEIEDAAIEFKQEDWGRDERYKFRMTLVNDEGTSFEEWYGSTNVDNSRPNADTPASFWYMVPVTNDQWANSFKFMDAADNNQVDIKVIFNATVPEYLHTVTPN